MELIEEIHHTEALMMNLEGNALMDVLVRLGTLNERYEHAIYEFLVKGGKTFNLPKLEQEAFVSKSAKGNSAYQFTYFDKHGAVGDLVAKSYGELAKKINDMGFLICHNNELKILY